jgi:hypothetical protein
MSAAVRGRDGSGDAELRPHEAPKVNLAGIEETVTDKGYHRGAW